MQAFGIVGWKNSGKTTLICRLVEHFKGLGMTVSTVKHTHHDVELDQPGKDSYKHRHAGASEVMLVSRNRWALFNEMNPQEPDLDALLEKLAPVDLILIEGFKAHQHPKIQVYREEMGNRALLVDQVPDLIAVASDCAVPIDKQSHSNLRILDLNDVATIGDFILQHCQG